MLLPCLFHKAAICCLDAVFLINFEGFFEDLCSKISYLAQFNLDICVCEIVRVECFCFIRTVVVDGDGVFLYVIKGNNMCSSTVCVVHIFS